MSNNQLAGFPAYGARVDTRITYHPRIITFEPAIEIGTSYPGTPQVQITIAADDYPEFTSFPVPCNYHYQVIAFVQNTSGGTRGLYAKYRPNSSAAWSSQISNSSISNNRWASLSTSQAAGVTSAIGDTWEIQIAADAGGTYLRSAAIIIYPRLLPYSATLKGLLGFEMDVSAVSLLAGKTATPIGYYLNMGLGIVGSSTWYQNTACEAGVRIPCFNMPPSAAIDAIYPTFSMTWWPQVAESFYQPYYPTRIAYTPML